VVQFSKIMIAVGQMGQMLKGYSQNIENAWRCRTNLFSFSNWTLLETLVQK